MTDRNSGVIRVWSCWIAEAEGIKLPYINQVACICRDIFSLSGEKISEDVAIQVTSTTQERMSAADINYHTRKHWGIENKGHHVRDTTHREDHNPTWTGNGPQAIGSLHSFTTILFRLKGVKSIKEMTELIHVNRTRALDYMAA